MILVAGRPLTFEEMCILLDMENEASAEVRNVLTQVRETDVTIFSYWCAVLFFFILGCLVCY